MDFDFTPDEEAFRTEVREFLSENLPPRNERPGSFLREWLEKVRARGWVGFSWPKAVGGSDGDVARQAILKEEMALAGAPPLGTSFMGLAWVGPGIIQYGTEEQKTRFIPDILDSKVTWCTGYSEPNHGSDLAAIQTKAERVGDHYRVNGQKIWTTGAPYADWMILLTRTDFNTEVKHDGITCLLVPMKTPGVEVRPIENMAGDRHFAEVFFTDAEVPIENRLGEEGRGWAVTISALANERSSIGEVTQMSGKLEDLKQLVRESRKQGAPASDDPLVRRQIAEFETKIAAMKYNGLRYLTRQLRGQPLSSETSVNKLLRASLEIEMDDFAVKPLGEIFVELAQRGHRRRHTQHTAKHYWRTYSRLTERLKYLVASQFPLGRMVPIVRFDTGLVY